MIFNFLKAKCLIRQLIIFSVLFNVGCVQDKKNIVSDLTAEHIFSENIEGPVWNDSCWFVVNFGRDGTIGTVTESGKSTLYLELPQGSNANAIRIDYKNRMFLADWPMHNILLVEPTLRQVSVFVYDSAFHQPNDLEISRKGVIYATDPDWKNKTGQIWMVDTLGKARVLIDNMGTTNGIALDPTEKILYVNESVQLNIWAFDVDESGLLSGKRLFMRFKDFGLDGMKCDREGNIYVTRHGKGTIAVISPNGLLIREIKLKGKKPSNLAFGSRDGRTCIVTLQDRGAIEFFRTEIPGKGF